MAWQWWRHSWQTALVVAAILTTLAPAAAADAGAPGPAAPVLLSPSAPPASPPAPPAATSTASPASPASPRSPEATAAPPIVILELAGHDVRHKETVEIGLGRDLEVVFDHAPPDGKLTLVLNGESLGDLPVHASPGKDATFVFALARTSANDAVWRRQLGLGRGGGAVPIAVGYSDKSTTAPASVRLAFFPSTTAAVCVLLLLALLVIVAVACAWKGMLRDAGPGSSLSLGRCQMFVWTLLVTGSFLVLWGVTGATDTITTQALVLIGISGATALGSVLVDASKSAGPLASIATAQAALASAAKAEKPAAQMSVDDAVAASPFKPMGGIADLLQDGKGWSLHRMQMVVWTLILAVLFVFDVARDLAMPQFGDTLLALMGISAGTYLGFKIPEAT